MSNPDMIDPVESFAWFLDVGLPVFVWALLGVFVGNFLFMGVQKLWKFYKSLKS